MKEKKIFKINNITEICLEKVIIFLRVYNRKHIYTKERKIKIVKDLKRIVYSIEKEIKKSIKEGYYIDLSYGERKQSVIITEPLKLICVREQFEEIEEINKKILGNYFIKINDYIYIKREIIEEIINLESYRKLKKENYINICKEIIYILDLSKEENLKIKKEFKKKYLIKTNKGKDIICTINPLIYNINKNL